MLDANDRWLLTCAADGELTRRQQYQLRRLLAGSAEARALLARLRADAELLRALPVAGPAPDLAPAILDAITARGLMPGRRPESLGGLVAAWAGLAAAAVVLLGLGIASFLYFSIALHKPAGEPVAQLPRDGGSPVPPVQPAPSADLPEPAPDRPRVSVAHTVGEGDAARPQPPRPPGITATKPGAHPAQAVVPAERARQDTVLTGPSEMFEIDQVNLALPVVLPLHALDTADTRGRLLAELHRSSQFRLELPCRSPARAVERVQAACNRLQVRLFVDAAAQERLRMTHLSGSFAMYLENVLPEELAALLEQIGRADREVSARKPLEGQFDRLVLVQLTARDRRELVALMGTDPSQPGGTAAAGPLGTDVRQPLAELTARQVGEALAGQGRPSRANASQAVARAPEYAGLLLACNAARPAVVAAPVLQFLQTRKAPRAGSMRILLVLRG
jgi:hypothetical protein